MRLEGVGYGEATCVGFLEVKGKGTYQEGSPSGSSTADSIKTLHALLTGLD